MASVPNLRGPREKMLGWVHLPRFVDKVRLISAGKLPPDYQENFCKGFDGHWLEASGANKDAFLEAVRRAKNDAEVAQWVRENVKKSPQEIEAFNTRVLTRGKNDETSERLAQRKKEVGVDRPEVQTFVDLIDADEGRL